MTIYERESLWTEINCLDKKLVCYADDLILAETKEEKKKAYNVIIKLVEAKKEIFKKYDVNYWNYLGSRRMGW